MDPVRKLIMTLNYKNLSKQFVKKSLSRKEVCFNFLTGWSLIF